MERSYETALKIIDSRLRRSRPTATTAHASAPANSSSSGTPGLRGTPSIEGMSEWLQMLGYSSDLAALNIIHVAGTKGKGSTCAFIESILRAHGQRTGFPLKTGLYTSPHLIKPEERIRINSKPLAPELIAKYVFELYDKLPQFRDEYDPKKALLDRGPRYLQLYALLAFHVFIREGVDVAIIETHSGGEYDATNVIQRPVVTAITTLGMDHIDMLGPTVENIAWHKAGIFKAGSIALSTVQEPGLEQVLKRRADEKGLELALVDEDSRLPPGTVQLKPAVQKTNASLAIAACEAWLRIKRPRDTHLTPSDIHNGIAHWSWPGRFQIISMPSTRCTWYLDAAHNDMSVKLAAQWFSESSAELSNSAQRILIFTHINELRDAEAVLRTLALALRGSGETEGIVVDHAIFTTYHASHVAAERAQASVPASFLEVWKGVFPGSQIHDVLSIDAAVGLARSLALEEEAHILVTGSQHLVGPALETLETLETEMST